MGIEQRLPQAWKKINELIEKIKTKADLTGANFTGEVNSIHFKADRGSVNMNIGVNESSNFGYLLTNNGAQIKLLSDKFIFNKPIEVEGTDINASKVSKSGDTVTGRLSMTNPSDQFAGLRGANNDMNLRLTNTQMGWAYTGVENYTEITNGFPMTNNANGLLTFNTHAGQYGHQLGFSGNGNMYHRQNTSAGFSSWSTLFSDGNCPISKNKNGYCKLANGLIIQWGQSGSYTSTGNKKFNVTLPTSFVSSYIVVANENINDSSYNSYTMITRAKIVGLSTIEIQQVKTGANNYANYVNWIAIGY